MLRRRSKATKRAKSKATKRSKSRVTNTFAAVRKVINEWQRAENRLHAQLIKMINDVERAAKSLKR